ncbi:hypothetical protein W911_11490 [Hyphomicrobium nitrativorans NL23]|uniref:YetF C-terminal domain-containing protein n=1 Tax=Hyphomicrobium nitrativorans NL23 TaxID=1029756 RepID=V5SFS8_9HYPH|nr:YetF domain-containing protein [Hyphomicrobium nitrativorans]AHB48885.1 hypothetical protein W911_11490 [Hyphomicrobium nitrativorans NL23]
MESLLAVDWTGMFVPNLGLLEVVLRGSLIYLALFVILRFMARRQAGRLGPADLLVIVLIADAAQNGLGDYSSVSEGVVLVLTIVAWEYTIDWAAWRFPKLRPILTTPSVKIVENGAVIDEAMRREMLTGEELMSQLRQNGVERLEEVRVARLEGDGRLSVLKRTSA